MTQVIKQYSSVAKFFHWSIAILVIVNFIGGLTLDLHHMYYLHMQSGLIILTLSILRIIWRLSHSYPLAIVTSYWENTLAKLVQFLLYLLLLAIPLSGILMVQAKGYVIDYLSIFQLPIVLSKQIKPIAHQFKEVHEYLAYTIIALVSVHLLGALKNHFLQRNQVLVRMLPKFSSARIYEK